MHVALPDPVDNEEEESDALLEEEQELDAEATVSGTSSPLPSPYPPPSSILSVSILDPAITNPSNATFLLYSNVITSLIGLTTFCLLWIPIPLLHWIGWEEFELPPSELILAIAGISTFSLLALPLSRADLSHSPQRRSLQRRLHDSPLPLGTRDRSASSPSSLLPPPSS